MLQKSQKALRLIFRQRTKQATIADQCGLKPATGIACEFGAWRRVPHIIFNRRAYGSENLNPSPQKDFCNNICQWRTCRCRLDQAINERTEPMNALPML